MDKIFENAYDKQAKIVISNKYVLANILKKCIPEYRSISKEEIINLIEDGEDSIYIKGLAKEDSFFKDSEIDYDVLFTSRLPKSKNRIGLIVNIELQNKSNVTYNLYNRMFYNVARLIARQKGEFFDHSNFDELKKVYSIWIFPTPKTDRRDSVVEYSMKRTFLKGNYEENEDYSFINIIALNVGKNYSYKEKDLLEMLSLLFTNTDFKKAEISKMLENDYGIINAKEEVSKMCNLSEGIRQEAFDDGFIAGLKQGAKNKAIENIIMLYRTGIPLDSAFQMLQIDDDLQKEVRKALEN